jgi:hypothetical protein
MPGLSTGGGLLGDATGYTPGIGASDDGEGRGVKGPALDGRPVVSVTVPDDTVVATAVEEDDAAEDWLVEDPTATVEDRADDETAVELFAAVLSKEPVLVELAADTEGVRVGVETVTAELLSAASARPTARAVKNREERMRGGGGSAAVRKPCGQSSRRFIRRRFRGA